MVSIGVDIGGTKISAGLVDNGVVVKSSIVSTPVSSLESAVVMSIILSVRDVWSDDAIGIGVGVPGLVDVENGIVYDVNNIPAFKNVKLKEYLEDAFNLPVHVSNDANCFVAGVKHYGEGKPYKNFVGLTLGTGLGGGLIINGKLHEGVGSGAGEFGYVPFRDGIMEHYCSGQFFKKSYQTSGPEVFEKAKAGDTEALKIFYEFGQNLGEAIKIIANVLAPEAIILGGSIINSFPFFEKSMWATIRDFPYGHVVDDLVVIPAKNPKIAVVGAAALVLG
jgi:glucokinase